MVDCSFCKRPAVIYLKYAGKNLCKEHFMRMEWRRINKLRVKEKLIVSGDKVICACSGGKDSTTLMHVLAKICDRPDIDLEVLSIDEGIKGYRSAELAQAKKHAKMLGLPHTILSFKDAYGMTLDRIVKENKDQSPCAYCGVLRRYLINKGARDLKGTKLATGHNADDEAQSILMNALRGDTKRMARTGAKVGLRDFNEFVPRIKIFRDIPEREIAAMSVVMGLNLAFHDDCPYAYTAFRQIVREHLNQIETESAGVKFNLLKFSDELAPILKKAMAGQKPVACLKCGEPTSRGKCKLCEMLENLK